MLRQMKVSSLHASLPPVPVHFQVQRQATAPLHQRQRFRPTGRYPRSGPGSIDQSALCGPDSCSTYPQSSPPRGLGSEPRTRHCVVRCGRRACARSSGTASSIGRCTVPVMMTGANTSTNRWRYQHARRTAGVARTRGDLPRAGRGSAGGLGRHRPSGGSTSHDGGPGDQRRGRP